jgi:predicted RNA-binding protein with RPS1 domain
MGFVMIILIIVGVSIIVHYEYKKSKYLQSDDNIEDTNNTTSDVIIFLVKDQNIEELRRCKEGDYVNLWMPKNDLTNIFIYRRGSIGGSGRIGLVPSKYTRSISNHLKSGLECEAEILDLNTGKIKCRLIPKTETDAKRSVYIKKASESISNEISKKYSKPPKDNFEIRIYLPKDHNQKSGYTLFLEKQPVSYYIANSTPLCIKLVDSQGKIVANKDNEPGLQRKILRAYFNNYKVLIKINSIENPDKYTLPYIKSIEAKAIVTFELKE